MQLISTLFQHDTLVSLVFFVVQIENNVEEWIKHHVQAVIFLSFYGILYFLELDECSNSSCYVILRVTSAQLKAINFLL